MISQNKLIHYSINFLEDEISSLKEDIDISKEDLIKAQLQRLLNEYTRDLGELRGNENNNESI